MRRIFKVLCMALVAMMTLALVPTGVSASASAATAAQLAAHSPEPAMALTAFAPNFNNTIFSADPTVGRIEIRSNLHGNVDGWFSSDSGDIRILSTGHFRNGVEYFFVRYPLFAGGHREGFARRDRIIVGGHAPVEVTFRQNTTVFRDSTMRTSFGTVWGGNRGSGYAWRVGVRGNNVQVIYRLDAGGHRMGWVPSSSINDGGGTISTALRFPLRGAMTHSSTVRTNGQLCDFRAALHTRVYAPGDGTVTFQQTFNTINGVRTLTSFGNQINWTSSDGRHTMRLAHLNSFNNVSLQIPSSQTRRQSANSGTQTITLATRQVRQGDLLGTTGTTGNSSGPHLHLELRHNGSPINPVNALRTW